MESPKLTESQAQEVSKKVSIVSDTDFADHRIMRCKNYSISYTREFTMLTSEHGTLFVNPEGGSIIMPEDNERELNRVVFMDDYIVSFYPNQPAVVRTITGVYIFSTEDKFRGFYSFGLNTNVCNAGRGVVLKENNQLFFVTASAQVVHYDLPKIMEGLTFKQEIWSMNNIVQATTKFDVNPKDICDGPEDSVYSMSATGEVSLLPGETKLVPNNEASGSKIFFTALAATRSYVCIAGYMKDNKHNSIQLLTADLTKETDGPITAPANSRLGIIKAATCTA